MAQQLSAEAKLAENISIVSKVRPESARAQKRRALPVSASCWSVGWPDGGRRLSPGAARRIRVCCALTRPIRRRRSGSRASISSRTRETVRASCCRRIARRLRAGSMRRAARSARGRGGLARSRGRRTPSVLAQKLEGQYADKKLFNERCWPIIRQARACETVRCVVCLPARTRRGPTLHSQAAQAAKALRAVLHGVPEVHQVPRGLKLHYGGATHQDLHDEMTK
jgi:hypothetical protein